MPVLIIDTAGDYAQLGLYEARGLMAQECQPLIHGYADALMPMVERVCPEPQNLEAVIVTTGPGSFTGMRVGLSVARALGLALSVPCLGVSSLQAVALSCGDAAPFGVALNTRRGDYYSQIFDNPLTAREDPTIRHTTDFSPEWRWIIDQKVDLDAVFDAYQKRPKDIFFENPAPLYVRDADAEKPKNLPVIDW